MSEPAVHPPAGGLIPPPPRVHNLARTVAEAISGVAGRVEKLESGEDLAAALEDASAKIVKAQEAADAAESHAASLEEELKKLQDCGAKGLLYDGKGGCHTPAAAPTPQCKEAGDLGAWPCRSNNCAQAGRPRLCQCLDPLWLLHAGAQPMSLRRLTLCSLRGSACATRSGQIVYDKVANEFKGCMKDRRGNIALVAISKEQAYSSCEEARKAGKGTGTLKLSGSSDVDTYCNQDLNGGGWELITKG